MVQLARPRRKRFDPLLTPHPEYLALGADSAARSSAYRALFDEKLPDQLVAEIRHYLQQQKALGTDRFRAWVEARTGDSLASGGQGARPRFQIVPDTISGLSPFKLSAAGLRQLILFGPVDG
jgi:hypothetical protein